MSAEALGDGARADGAFGLTWLRCTAQWTWATCKGVGRRLGSPLAELSVMANDRRETTLNDVWRNPPWRTGQTDIGKSAELIGCAAESH